MLYRIKLTSLIFDVSVSIHAKAKHLRTWKMAELGPIKIFLQQERDAGRYQPVWPGLD